MKFKAGDYIVWGCENDKYYEKILEINKEEEFYKYLDIRTGSIRKWELYWIDNHARLMTQEEKIELL